MRIALYDSLVAPTTEVAGIFIVVAAALCGGYLVLNHQTHLFGIRISNEPLTHGLMSLFFGMLAGASDPVRRLTTVFNSVLPRDMQGRPLNPIARFPEVDTADRHNQLAPGEIAALLA